MFAHILIAIFFFLIGLEIRDGLTNFKKIIFPAACALGGMALPALIFLVLEPESPAWAVVMPTDIALAIGVLSLLGKRVSQELRLFLLTLAVADDLFSLLILVIFYSDSLNLLQSMATLGSAAFGFLLGSLNQRLRQSLISILSPIGTFLIVPLYLAIEISHGLSLSSITSSISISIVMARVIGKFLGITLIAYIFFRRQSHLPLAHVAGIGAIAGMGLTVSLVIAEVAVQDQGALIDIRTGLLVSALLSGALGYFWLRKVLAS